MSRSPFIRYSLLALTAAILMIVIFFNQELYSPETKIEDFREDYMSGRLDVGSIWRNTHSLGLDGDFSVSWHWKNNEAYLENLTSDQSVNQLSLDSLTLAMSFGIERIKVCRDTALQLLFTNGKAYSDLQLWLCEKGCQHERHLQGFTVYSDEAYPGRLEFSWAYELREDMWLVKSE